MGSRHLTAGTTVEAATRARWRATGLPTSVPGRAAGLSAEEVRRLGGVQAQELEMTLWSLGRRTGESRAAVLDAFERGEFVRTHALRQTWHFVHRDDLTAVQAATAPRVQRLNAAMYRQEGLDEQTLRRAGDLVAAAVAETPLPRARLAAVLDAAGIPTSGFRLGLILMWAELECLVVSGPLAGRQHTYAAWPDRALPDRDGAVAALVERFFSSHGPATVEDFTTWSSLTRTETRNALAGLPVNREQVDGVELLWLGDLDDAAWASPQVELLNGYDEYVSGLSARGKRWLDRAGLARGRRDTPVHLVVVDGQLAGHWRRTVSRGGVIVEVLPLRPFPAAERQALEEHVAVYARFLELPAELRLLS